MMFNKNTPTRTYTRNAKSKKDLSILTPGEIPIEFENACRLCLEKSDIMCEIFSGNDSIIPIVVKIRSLLALEINEEDQLPTMICDHCSKLLNDYYNFKKRCLASDVKLRQFLCKWPPKRPVIEVASSIDEDCLCLTHEICPLEHKKDECTISWDDQVPLAAIITSKPECVDSCGSDLGIDTGQGQVEGAGEKQNDTDVQKNAGKDCSKQPVKRPAIDPIPAVQSNKQAGRLTSPKSSLMSKYVSKMRNVKKRPVDFDVIPLQKRLELESLSVVQTRKQEERITKSSTDIQCPKCKAKIPSEKYDNHKRKCVSKNPCPTCSKPFVSRSLLKRHMRVHTGERPFVCNLCNTAYSQKEILLRHNAQIHTTNKPHECAMCDKKFALPLLLNMHMKSAHFDNEAFKCKLCPKQFRHSSGLSRHQNAHNGTIYFCKVCGRKFSDGSSVKRHLKFNHNSVVQPGHTNGMKSKSSST